MSRKLLVNIHLYLATFFTPILLMFALSGGLYLLGYKGEVTRQVVYQGSSSEINFAAEDMDQEVKRLLESADLDADFDYVKGRGQRYFTRPTSSPYYVVEAKDDSLIIEKNYPDLVKTLVELHKGHGPLVFRTLEKVSAVGLIVILLSGLWLGLATKSMRSKTLLLTSAGMLTFVVLGLA